MMPKRKDGETGQRTAREQIEYSKYAALLTLEQLGQSMRINAGHWNMRANTIYQQGAQQEPQPAPEVAELASLAESIGGGSSQGYRSLFTSSVCGGDLGNRATDSLNGGLGALGGANSLEVDLAG